MIDIGHINTIINASPVLGGIALMVFLNVYAIKKLLPSKDERAEMRQLFDKLFDLVRDLHGKQERHAQLLEDHKELLREQSKRLENLEAQGRVTSASVGT